MRQKFSLNAEFLLPENFSGGFLEALELYTEHCKKTWDNQPRLPSNLPDSFCFPFVVENGGAAYTTFGIESWRFEDLTEPWEAESALEEQEQEELWLTESSQSPTTET